MKNEIWEPPSKPNRLLKRAPAVSTPSSFKQLFLATQLTPPSLNIDSQGRGREASFKKRPFEIDP